MLSQWYDNSTGFPGPSQNSGQNVSLGHYNFDSHAMPHQQKTLALGGIWLHLISFQTVTNSEQEVNKKSTCTLFGDLAALVQEESSCTNQVH